MYDPIERLYARALDHLKGAVRRVPGRVRLVAAAAFGPPARIGSRAEAEILVVAEPLPAMPHRVPWFEASPTLRLRFLWRGPGALVYPSPRYLEILHRGQVLYDPEGWLAGTLRLLLDSLTEHGLELSRADPFPCWTLTEGWPTRPLIPAPPQAAGAGPGGRALAP